MHELSIALRIVDIAEEEAKKAGADEVTDLEIEVGKLSGVIVDALEFAMIEAVRNSVLEKTRIDILEIDSKARCNSCHSEFEINELYDICPHCQSINLEILTGQELRVKSLKVK